jgi:hypothetical protein
VTSPAAEGPPPRPDGPAPVGVGDIFATAFARYGGGFATFGVMTVAAAALPAVVLGLLLATSSPALGFIAAETLLATVAYLSLVGAVAAVLGGRLQQRVWPIIGTSVLASPVIALCILVLGPAALLVLPFLGPFFVLAPVAAGAGDAAGAEACRRSFTLVARRGYTRSLGVMAGLELIGLLLWLGLTIALSPVSGTAHQVIAGALWTLIFWPLSALVFRNLYGSLTGRLVVRLRNPR